jgi:transforming growth factor-beta-induced protein
MKNVKFLAYLFLGISLSASIVACSDDDEDDVQPTTTNNNSQQNIAQIAIAGDETDSLVVALAQAGLVSTFEGSGNFTVFAPSNQAFADFIAATPGVNLISDIPNTLLTNTLLYHVLNTEVKSADLSDNLYAATLNTEGPNGEAVVLKVNTTNGVSINNNASVLQADIDASNGVIHLIDAVISPKNIVELAINDSRFDSLVVALTQPTFTYATTLSGNGPFTVFAPTNQAFVDLLATNGSWNNIADIDANLLSAVLEYHVVNGSNERSDALSQGQIITTLGNGTLTVDLSNGAQLMTSDTSQAAVNIIITDVQGTNGVIHAVESVLLP